MKRYLITFEYKEKVGHYQKVIQTNTTTKVFTEEDLKNIDKYPSHGNYIKILSCYQL